MVAAVCPRCTGVVALHEGRPFVSASGAIELWHATCWSVRHARGVEEVTVIAPQPSRKLPFLGAAAVAALAAIGIASYSLRVKLPAASLATINFDTSEPIALGATLSANEAPPPAFDPRDAYPVPVVDNMPLD